MKGEGERGKGEQPVQHSAFNIQYSPPSPFRLPPSSSVLSILLLGDVGRTEFRDALPCM